MKKHKPGSTVSFNLTTERIKALDRHVFKNATCMEEVSRAYFISQWIDAGCPITPAFGPRRTIPKDNGVATYVPRDPQQTYMENKLTSFAANPPLPASPLEAQEALFDQSVKQDAPPPLQSSPITADGFHTLGEPIGAAEQPPTEEDLAVDSFTSGPE